MSTSNSSSFRSILGRGWRWLSLAFGKLYPRLSSRRRRRIWSAITILALVLLTVSAVYTWRELPAEQRQIRSAYLGLAVLIYIATYVMHLLGWQAIATLSFGRLPFRVNVEAVASSDLVKTLPTVVWHIARRVDFYLAYNIPKRSVSAASLLEMVLMMVTGAMILLFSWLVRTGNWWGLAVTLFVVGFLAAVGSDKIRQWWSVRIAAHQASDDEHKARHWLMATFWYGLSWFGGVAFLTVILQIFAVVEWHEIPALLFSWLIAGLAGYLVSLTLGAIGIAREVTLTFLLAQSWPLHASVAAAIMVKLVLTLGQVGCAMLILGGLHLLNRDK